MLSNKCKYAIRAVLYLAVNSVPERKFHINEIAAGLKIPIPFLGKILQDLVKRNLISSAKGPRGGFFLSDENNKSSIIKIIEAIDGLSFFSSCILGLENCSDSYPCPIHHEYKSFRDRSESLFRNKTIGEVSREIAASDVFIVT